MAEEISDNPVPPSETLERMLASNDKVQFDNLISSTKNTMTLAELSLSEAVAFQAKANNLYLQQMDAREKQRVEHSDALEKQRTEHANTLREHGLENNRFSLDRLYGLYPEESMGTTAGMRMVLEILRKEGLIKSAEQ